MELPDELHVHVFSYLSAHDLCSSVEGVCQQWRRLAGEGSLWRRLMVVDGRSAGRVHQVVAAKAAAQTTERHLLLHLSSPLLLPSVLLPAPTASVAREAAPHCWPVSQEPWKHCYRRVRAEERNWAAGSYRTVEPRASASRGCEYLDFNGRHIVSGGWDNGIKIFDVAHLSNSDHKESALFPEPVRDIKNAHEDGILSVKIVEDQFLSCSSGSIALWDLESGALQKVLQVEATRFVFADIDTHKRFIAAGLERGHVVVWARSEGETEHSELRSVEKSGSPTQEDLFSSDSQSSSSGFPILSSDSQSSSSAPLFPPSFFTTSPSSFIFSPPPPSPAPSSPLTTSTPPSSSSSPKWRKLQLLQAHSKKTRVVHFPKWSDGGLLVSASYDGMIALWRTDLLSTSSSSSSSSSTHRGDEPQQIAAGEPRAFYHASDVVCLTSTEYDPHMLFSGGFDCTVQLWDLRTAPGPSARAKGAPPSSAVAAYDWKAVTRRVAHYDMTHKPQSNAGFYISALDCDDWKLIAGVGHQLWIWDRRKLDKCMSVVDVCPPSHEVWCARAWGTLMAAGSGDGFVRLFDYSPRL